MEYLLLTVGIILLVVGGDLLVKSAVGLANKFKVSPLLIGITIVSFGTSAPELIVSLKATLDGKSGIAIGNIIGSNVANIGLVLGLTVALRPVLVNRKKYFASWLIMFISTLMFYMMVLFRWSNCKNGGFFFVAGLLAFISISISYMRNEDEEEGYNVSLNPLLIFVFFF